MRDKISVIVAVYNAEKYLRDCIESIIHQTYANLEIILVNDGSKDASGQICDDYAKRDERIKVLHKRNQGLSAARNDGLDTMTGDFVVFVDSDDWVNHFMIERLYEALEQSGSDMGVCSFRYVYEAGCDGRGITGHSPLKNEVLNRAEAISKLFEPYGWYYVVAWNKIYRKKLWAGLRYPHGLIHEDEYVIHRLFLRCERIVCSEEELYFYRQVPGSIMNVGKNIKTLDRYAAFADRICVLDSIMTQEQRKYLYGLYFFSYMDDYFFYYRDNKKSVHLKRMRQSLRKVLFVLMRNHYFSPKSLAALIIFLVNPGAYQALWRK